MINAFNCIIYDYSELAIEKDVTVSKIVAHTANTWQPARGTEEKGKDTTQGKMAEQAVILYLSQCADSIRYIPYDEIRKDNFQKHAPFDGVLVDSAKVSEETLSDIFQKINDEIDRGSFGQISASLRSEMLAAGVFSVEVKSTKVNDKKCAAANFKSYDKDEEIANLLNAICQDDFLTYPHYTRKGDYNWESYCNYCKKRNSTFSQLSGSALSDAVKAVELANMDEFYIRVYMDDVHEKALILGFITKGDFMEFPLLKKMIHKGKSEKALYLAKNLNYRKPLNELIALIEK